MGKPDESIIFPQHYPQHYPQSYQQSYQQRLWIIAIPVISVAIGLNRVNILVADLKAGRELFIKNHPNLEPVRSTNMKNIINKIQFSLWLLNGSTMTFAQFWALAIVLSLVFQYHVLKILL